MVRLGTGQERETGKFYSFVTLDRTLHAMQAIRGKLWGELPGRRREGNCGFCRKERARQNKQV